MANFAPKVEDATDKQLSHWVNESSPHYGKLASDEWTRRNLDKLREAIDRFDEQSSRQTKKMIMLTWFIVTLTIVLVMGLFIQIALATL